MSLAERTVAVLRQKPEKGFETPLHFPVSEGSLEPRCGAEGDFTAEDRPVEWAGVWCTNCMGAGIRPTGSVAS